MNKSVFYVFLLFLLVVFVAGQNQPAPPSGSSDQTTAQATPTPAADANATPTPDLSATPQSNPQPSVVPAATATPDTGATAQATATPEVAVTPAPTPIVMPEITATPMANPTATAEVTPAPTEVATATPTPSPTASPTPRIALTNRVEVANAPTDSDMYCSGFVSHRMPSNTFVVGGLGSPQQTRFGGNDIIYLHGPTLATGSKVLLLRHVGDPMINTESYPGQKRNQSRYGSIYQELGIATITGVVNHVMTATLGLVCDPVTLADTAIPLPDRVRPTYRPPSIFTEHMSEPNGKITGRIILANQFDWVLGQGSHVYINLGEEQLKPGDYLKITRTYTASLHDPMDKLDFENNTDEPSRAHSESGWRHALIGKANTSAAFDARRQVGSFPRRTIGELMVLYTTRTTATAIITSSVEQAYIGDMVELEEPQAESTPTPIASEEIPGSSTSASNGMNPPVITCQAQSASVHAGEPATVVCNTSSPDNHPVSVAFEASRGNIQIQDRTATIDTRGLDPGVLSVKATATDDRNLSSSASTLITVQPPATTEGAEGTEGAVAAPTASKVADLSFKRNSSYVDNRSKAALDDIALRLQKEPNSSAVIVGSNAEGEPAALAEQRARNAGEYLTKEKGIGPDRVQPQVGGIGSSGASVWILPAGATMPDVTAPPANPTDNTAPNNTPPNNTPNNTAPPDNTNNPGTPNNPGDNASPGTTNQDNGNNPPINPGQVIPRNVPPEVR